MRPNVHFVKFSVILAMFLMTFSPSGAWATNYFSWGVENPKNYATSLGSNVQVWVDPWFGNSTNDCTVAHSGSCSLRLNVQNNDGGNQQMGPDVINNITYPFNIIGGPTLYYRWWMKIQPGFNWGTSEQKTKSSRTLGPITSRVYTGYVHGGGFRISECDGAGGCTVPGGGANNDYRGIDYDMDSMADGVWHEYVVSIRPNSTTSTPDAQFRAWVDGVEVQHSPWCSNSSTHCATGTTGFIFHTKQESWIEAWGGWMVRPYFQLGNNAGGGGGTMYLDDFSTDNTWNSIFAPPSQTTPTTPAGLTVTP